MVNSKVKILFLTICILQLFYLFHFRSGFKYEVIKDPFGENSGISHVVSPAIIESRSILKKYEATNFYLSKKLKDDDYFYQRLAEFNYPIKMEKSSELIFFSLNEDIDKNCKLIETGEYLKLTQC